MMFVVCGRKDPESWEVRRLARDEERRRSREGYPKFVTSCRGKQTKIRQCKDKADTRRSPGRADVWYKSDTGDFLKLAPPKKRRQNSSQLSTSPGETSVWPCSLRCISQPNKRLVHGLAGGGCIRICASRSNIEGLA